MKNSYSSVFALAVFAAMALVARAQPAPKILVVDIGKVFDNHYEKKEKEAELRSEEQKDEEAMQNMVKEGNALVDQYKNLAEQAKNPALTPEAQSKADADSKKLMDQITAKQNDLNNYKAEVQRNLQQRVMNVRGVLIDEISRTAADIAKRHGATLLFDKSGIAATGANFLLYSDSAYDITDEVIKKINKDHPQPAAGSSSSDSTAPASDAPKVVVPGLTPKS